MVFLLQQTHVDKQNLEMPHDSSGISSPIHVISSDVSYNSVIDHLSLR